MLLEHQENGQNYEEIFSKGDWQTIISFYWFFSKKQGRKDLKRMAIFKLHSIFILAIGQKTFVNNPSALE